MEISLRLLQQIRFDYILEGFSLLIDFHVTVRIFVVVIVVSRVPSIFHGLNLFGFRFFSNEINANCSYCRDNMYG